MLHLLSTLLMNKNKKSRALFLISLYSFTLNVNCTIITSCLANSCLGKVAFKYATKYCCKKIIKGLIYGGAIINDSNNYGETSLMLAACNGYKDVIELMIGRGATLKLEVTLDLRH